MALDMVDIDQRFFQRIGECLRFRYTDEQGTDEARTIGYRDGIDVVEGTVCFLQRELDDVVDLFEMLTGSNLRHDPAVLGMNRDLR